MDGRFMSNNPFANEQDDPENSPENSGDSPRSGSFNDSAMTSTSSPKKSRRGVLKRVVTVPIRDVEGSRLKGDSAPPSDSWAWRKYGQKPIKGSPYPRAYYRCSSSKGCPARKQVERSRVDPTTIVMTYSCEHNHPLPASKHNPHHRRNHHHSNEEIAPVTTAAAVAVKVENSDDEKITGFENQFTSLVEEDSLINSYEFKWFSNLESSDSSAMLESPIFDDGDARDRAMIFTMAEEDESLFADLGELPECSVVFRRGALEREEEHRRCNLSPWCGTTG